MSPCSGKYSSTDILHSPVVGFQFCESVGDIQYSTSFLPPSEKVAGQNSVIPRVKSPRGTGTGIGARIGFGATPYTALE